MVRPQTPLLTTAPAATPPTAHVSQSSEPWSNISSDQILYSMLAASLVSVLFRMILTVFDAARTTRSTSIPETAGASAKFQFLVFAAVNVLLQIGGSLSQGLLATKWVLAGEQVGPPLVACFCLVAASTELLVSAGLAAHIRSVLVKAAIKRQIKIRFTCISHMFATQVGKLCILLIAVSVPVLVFSLSDKPLKLAGWLGANVGILLWANSQFKSIGLMDWEVWDELKPITQSASRELTVVEFLQETGLTSPQEGSSCSDRWRCKLNDEDELLLRHRRSLMLQVFPGRRWLCFVHGCLLTVFTLLGSAVPAVMVCYCLSQVPKLVHVDVVGGWMPDFEPTMDRHYIRLEEDWKASLTLNFDLDLGQASRFLFCRPQGACEDLEPRERSDQVTLSAIIDPSAFGTCNLTLFGIRSRTYHFTVLALTHLKAQLQPVQKVHFPEYQVQLRHYRADIVQSANMTRLGVQVAVSFDSTFMKMESSAQSCHPKSNECRIEEVQPLPDSRLTAGIDLATSSNLSLLMKLQPKESTVCENLTVTYAVDVSIIDIIKELEILAESISVLQARADSMLDFDSVESKEVGKQLQVAMQKRDNILRQAYEEKTPEMDYSTSLGKLTFLAVGLTGTGKSELCRWMTGNLDKCTPSSGTTSKTSEVIRVQSLPFKDPKMSPMIEWIDTPGRGDTRGQAEDAELWNSTMRNLLSQSESRIDNIVWVMNAAWQRGTADRDLMLRELRRSFGIQLYPHLSIVLNFLPHSANKTQFAEELATQKEKYADWIMSVEDEMFSWGEEARRGVEKQVKALAVYGVSIDPKHYRLKPDGLPLSAPYLRKFPPFSHPAGAADLLRLFNSTRERKVRGAPGLLVNNSHPRIGPGILQSLDEISCDLCGFHAQADQGLGGTPNLVPGLIGKRLRLRGTDLSMDDGAIAVPRSAECGDPDAKQWPPSWHRRIARSRNLTSNVKATHIDVLLSAASGISRKLCFCEAPNCNESWRFGQGGLDIPPSGYCPEPFHKIPFMNSRFPPMFFAQVGSRLVGLVPPFAEHPVQPELLTQVTPTPLQAYPAHLAPIEKTAGWKRPQEALTTAPSLSTIAEEPIGDEQSLLAQGTWEPVQDPLAAIGTKELPVIDMSSNEVWGLKLDEDELHDLGGGGRALGIAKAAVIDDVVYVLLSEAERLLTIDMKSNTTAVFGSVFGNRSRFPPRAYNCIVAHHQDLYLLPGRSDHVLRINVVTKVFTTHPFPTSWGQWKAGLEGTWAYAIVVQDKIFAFPTEHGASSFILVVRLGSEITFNRIDAGRIRYDDSLYESHSRKFGAVALDGRVYAGPIDTIAGKEIWVLSAASEEKVASIPVEQGFCGAVVWGRTIVMPSCIVDKLLFVNVDTEEQQIIDLPYRSYRGDGIDMFAFGSSLYLAPYSNNQFLRVDLENRTIC